MVPGRLLYDILLVLVFAFVFAVFVFSFLNWKRNKQQKVFWYLIILGSYLLYISSILLGNYLNLANTVFADSSLNIVLDDSYWSLVSAFLKVGFIAGLIYGINHLAVHYLSIPGKGKKRLLAISLLLILILTFIFLVIIKRETASSLFVDASSVVNGILFPVGCLVAGFQAVTLLIPSIAAGKTSNKPDNYRGMLIFSPFLIFPIADLAWFIGLSIENYVRLSYFAVIPMLIIVFRELKPENITDNDSLVHNKTKLEVICKNFGISERERDVLSLVIIGTSQKDIADSLNISVNTVKSHLQNIYKKIGVSGRLQLIFKINSIN